VPVADSKPTTPRKVSHAAWFSAGSELTRSRIICQATMLRAPSGGGPIAKETEHCGQKQIRCAADFCRGLTLRSARTYTRQPICVPLRAPDYSADNAGFPKVCSSQRAPPRKNIVSTPLVQVGRKIPVVDGLASRTPCRKPQINSRARTELRRDNLPAGTILCSSQKRAASRTLWR
jgi:hypothetical protein